MADTPGAARLSRSGDLMRGIEARLAVLEETDSFLIAVTETPITVGNEWVQIDGMLLGPQGFPNDTADLVLPEDADCIRTTRKGKHHLMVDCEFVSATADGWFEAAIEGHAPDVDLWPTDVTKGHRGTWLPAAALGWENASLGFSASVIWPCAAADDIIASAKFVTADGLGTVDVNVVVYVTRLPGL